LRDIWLLPNKAAFDNCDFSAAIRLASANHGASMSSTELFSDEVGGRNANGSPNRRNLFTYTLRSEGAHYFSTAQKTYCQQAYQKVRVSKRARRGVV
jgi:hypothetical protein